MSRIRMLWAGIWNHIPVVVRAIVVGLLVLVAGNFLPQGLLAANMKSPDVPWSLPLIAVYLWIYWHYVQGRWWPRSTSEVRRSNLRAVPLSPRLWGWSLAGGALGIGALLAVTYAVAYLIPLGLEAPTTMYQLPGITLVAIVITISFMAGMVEEAAFRGYMQGPIERRHGAVGAIITVSIVFTLAHFPGSLSASPRMLLIFIASIGYGTLAHLTGSILPGIVLHIAQDLTGSALLWLSKRGGSSTSNPELPAWTDTIFLLSFVAAVVLAAGTVLAFRRLAAAAKQESR